MSTAPGSYVSGTWTSGVTQLSFGFNELVASWNAITPPGTWIQVEVLPQLDDGHWASKWYVLGQWSSDDYSFHRTSIGGQGNADGFVSIDTWFAKDHPAIAYRLQATLYRKVGTTTDGPTLSRLSAIASNLTNQKGSFPSKTTMTGPRRRPRRAAVLAGDPPRRLPAVRQRRRGLVQPDLDGNGRRLLDAEDGLRRQAEDK